MDPNKTGVRILWCSRFDTLFVGRGTTEDVTLGVQETGVSMVKFQVEKMISLSKKLSFIECVGSGEI